MRSVLLILMTIAACLVLGWNLSPAEPGQYAEPDYPWRHTADGWVKATWLPKVVSGASDQPREPYHPINVPHPLYLVVLQVLAITYAAVSEWPDDRREKIASKRAHAA